MALVVSRPNGANGGGGSAAASPPAPLSLAAHQVRAAGVDVDTLPYIDVEIDTIPGMRDTVNKLVAAELQRIPNQADMDNIGALAYRPLEPKSEALRHELQRIESQQTMPALDTTRYQLEGPAGKERQHVSAWEAAVHNSQAQLQHQNLRLINLELLQKYGSNAWRMHNYQLEATHKLLQVELESVQKQITELNRARKLDQTQAAALLANLDAQWYELTTKNAQIEAACRAYQAQLAYLRPQPASAPIDYHAHHYADRDGAVEDVEDMESDKVASSSK